MRVVPFCIMHEKSRQDRFPRHQKKKARRSFPRQIKHPMLPSYRSATGSRGLCLATQSFSFSQERLGI